jgi:hypothetical protein
MGRVARSATRPKPPHALELVLLLDPLCGQVSFVEELELPLEVPLLDDALVFALGEAEPVAANACVTPRPPTSRPDATTVATAPLRSCLIMSITSSPRLRQADSRELRISGERGEKVR